MATLREIRKRIGSVKGTQQITKAMKMVAAAKLRRSQEEIIAARPYSDAISRLFRHLAEHAEDCQNPLLQQRQGQRTTLLVLTSDRGLCGGFNHNLLRQLGRHIKQQREEEIELVIVGKKGIDYTKHRPQLKVLNGLEGIINDFNFGQAVNIAKQLSEHYLAEKTDRVVILYNRFLSPLRQEVTFQPLFPINNQQQQEQSDNNVDYLYEPNRQIVWNEAIPKYINFEIFRCLLDSIAGEFGARMTSMDAASKNAAEMIDNLTLQMNRARQETITGELLEIIAGKEAQGG